MIYTTVSLLSLFLIPWAIAHWHETNLPPLIPQVRGVINLVYLNWAVSFFMLMRRSSEKPLPKARWWVVFAVIAVALCVVYPVFSGDLMEYLIRGRILGIYHQSPYQHVPAEFPNDLLYAHSTWKTNPDSYGPLSVGLETIPALFFPNSVTGMVWLEKLIFLGFMALGIYFFARLASGFDKPGSAALSTMFFALNPLLWVSTLIDGHNDTVMLALTIAAVYFLLRRRFSACFLLWTAAFLVKYTVVVLLPFFVITAVRHEAKRTGRFPWGFIAKEIAVNTAVIFLAFRPLWAGWNTFLALEKGMQRFYTNTIPYAAHEALSRLDVAADPTWVAAAFWGAFFCAVLYWLWIHATENEPDPQRLFRRFGLVYVSFCLALTTPLGFHFLLWALPWLILSHWPMERLLITLYAFAGLYSYCKRINYLLILAGVIYFGALAIRRFTAARQDRRPA